jgi:hypothetical protein
MGTAAEAAMRVRMELWRQGRESQPAENSPREIVEPQGVYPQRRGDGAQEALPHTPPGGKPPETPGAGGLTKTGLLMEAATTRERGRT